MIQTTKTVNGKTYEYYQHDLVIGKNAKGNPKKKTFTGKTKTAVNKKIEAFKKKFYAGTYANTKQTLADYLTNWLKDYQHEVKPRTFQINRDLVNKKIIPGIGSIKLADLTPTNVRDLLREVRETSAAYEKNRCKKSSKEVSLHAGVRTAQQVRQTFSQRLKSCGKR